MLYWPSAFVTVVRTTPVLVLVAVTVAPGRTALSGSRTRPLKVPVAWAEARPIAVNRKHGASHAHQKRARGSLIRISLSDSGCPILHLRGNAGAEELATYDDAERSARR